MIQIYSGGYGVVKQSGVGQAIVHQKKILNQMHVQVTDTYQEGAGIVHINTVLPDSVWEAMQAKIRGQKVVYYAHSTQEDFKNSFTGSNLIAPLFRLWIMFCYNLGDIVITPTPYSKRILEGYGMKKPIYVMSNGVDTKFFHPDVTKRKTFRQTLDVTEEKKIVVSVGHLIERKGILDFLEVARAMPDTLFLWYGQTAESMITKNVKEAMESKPDNVWFMGFAKQEQLVEAYQASDAFLFLSNEETEGIVVLEALACEIPVIVKDIPVYEEWLADKESVHKVMTSAEAIQITAEVLKHTQEDMISHGRKVVNLRSFQNLGTQLLAIYRQEGWVVR